MRIAIVGESLIDFTATGPLAFQGHEGGGPSNCAVAAARLGQATGYISQLSRDLFGERLYAYLGAKGVDLRFVLGPPPSWPWKASGPVAVKSIRDSPTIAMRMVALIFNEPRLRSAC